LSILIQVLKVMKRTRWLWCRINPLFSGSPSHRVAESILMRFVCNFDHNWYKRKEAAVAAGSSLENLKVVLSKWGKWRCS